MTKNFQKISQFLKEITSSNLEKIKISTEVKGVRADQWLYLVNKANQENPVPENPIERAFQLHIFKDQAHCEEAFYSFRDDFFGECVILPGLENSPYGGYVEGDQNLAKRIYAYSKILNFKKDKRPLHLFLTIDALLLKSLPASFLNEHILDLTLSDIVSPYDLAGKLVSMGYDSTSTVEEEGTFSKKGEIFDIFPIGSKPVRIYYFDDMIEEIFLIDQETQKTQRNEPLEKISILPSPQILRTPLFTKVFREQLPRPLFNESHKVERRRRILEDLSDGILFENYSHYLPYFFKDTTTAQKVISDCVDSKDIFINEYDDHGCEENYTDWVEKLRDEYSLGEEDRENENLLGNAEFFYSSLEDYKNWEIDKVRINEVSIDINLQDDLPKISPGFESFSLVYNKINISNSNERRNTQSIVKTIEKADYSKVFISYQNENSRKEIFNLFETFAASITSRLKFEKIFLKEGFSYHEENSIFLTESDFFTSKLKKTSSRPKRKNVDLFAEQLSSLKSGDFIVHNVHGVGVYCGLTSMDIGGSTNDFLEIEYEGKDRVYVPVYKINLVQKFADKDAAVKVSNLRTNKFDAVKKKAKESAKKLAFNLLKLLAERETSKAYSYTPPDDLYREFEFKFSFVETPDQEKAIIDTIEDMQKPKPMDRLICGDVGFGKTEVAMRAAFKAILDQKQVAVLVPTTVLALQHFNSFQKRFKEFPVKIEFLSRFKTPKQTKEILERLETGNLDIIIGTHKLLSNKIKYKDLGLVVVDEEQRFGVTHKEKLKLLKANLDFLTLTATPIPRTLQMAFLGLRDLSVIQTAPPKRQSIKTYIIKKDDHTIREAINKELKRGGQVFFVHNRVRDIEEVHAYIKELCPTAKVAVGHGQMSEKELETKMNDFYSGKYNVLLSTTIIESGIDIPTANTMIVDRADMYGLSQLHQLRGRIGRSDRKAYAYFVIPNEKKINEIASKRLKALQTYADMGSGFSIASSDLEIRGAGDLLGAEQSGHIEAVGLEVYMELLQDAIAELKGEKKQIIKDVEIQTPFGTYIPNNFIEDSSERLKTYKRLSNAEDIEELDSISEELEDRYGILPEELKNLIFLLRSRYFLKSMGVEKAKFTERSLYLFFSKAAMESNTKLRESVISFFLNDKAYKFSPDFSVSRNFKSPIKMDQFFSFSKEIADKIVSD